MSTLSRPGPSRPHHPSYSEPGPLMSLRGLAITVLGAGLLAGLSIVLEAVS